MRHFPRVLHVHRSHRLEALAAALAGVMRTPLRAALAAEIVVVQSLGMRRWLSLDLAPRLGVTMNVRFPFPAGFAQQVFRAAFPGEVEDAGFRRELLPWRVLGLLPDILAAEDAADLRHYLEGGNAALKAYQLAQRIAATFDRYLAYRPELLLQWEKLRRPREWQAQLWQALAGGAHRDAHPPALLRRLEAMFPSDGLPLPLPGLPERISVFGLSSLPPLYLHLVSTLARCLDVHLFLLEPTDQYWADTLSQREQDRRLRTRGTTAGEEHYEIGSSLLSSFGKAGREFARLVQDLLPLREPTYFDDPESVAQRSSPTAPLLHRVQADIFALTDRARRDDPAAGDDPAASDRLVAADDDSIRIHCCHGPMRELEVLHDQLLDLFSRRPGLTPRDILVAMPDVEAYAPFIDAVFGSPEAPHLAIPFTVADRSGRAESSVADAFLRLLDLHGSRFTAPAVLALLDCAALRARFAFRESDLEVLRTWVAECAIRWGIDEAHRADLGLPGVRDHTWRAGLDRLLLGYALPGDEHTLFAGLLPFREIEGALAGTLGQFVAFAEGLFAKVPALAAPRPLPQWAHAGRDLLRTFFDDGDEFTDELRRVREILAALEATARGAAFAEPVTFEVLRAHLAGALSHTDSGLGFLGGAVTFCALKPMRAIPFQVLCLLGMNDTAFPRRDPGLAFDRMLREPRRGDRSQRDDDRYVFLEAILSARAVLHLSYTGRSARDNSAAPPSVVLSELLDYLAENYRAATGDLRAQLVTGQKLQPFSPDYFTEGSRLFSYSAENARPSAGCTGLRTARARFAATPLPPPGPEWCAVDVEKLAAFFAHPARYFARERLGLALPEEFAPLEETEPLSLDGLARYQLGQELTQVALGGAAPAAQLPALRARGTLPHGYCGASEFGTVGREAVTLAARIRAFVSSTALPPQSVDAVLGDWRLTGTLQGLYPEALVRHRAARLKGKDLLSAWLQHLALQLTGAAPRETLLFARDGAWRFAPLDHAPSILTDLLTLYREGLQTPLPLFPETSHEYARRTLRPRAREKTAPIAAARGQWFGSKKGARGEVEDAWFRLAFPPDTDPLDARWEEIARRVFQPLFDACQEVAE